MVLALHGNIGTVHDFDFLSDSREVEAVDLWPLTDLSMEKAARKLPGFLPENNAFRGLIAYSMGGRLALQALAEDPDFWDFAIIISAHPGLKNEEDRNTRRQQDANWAAMIRQESWEYFLKEWNTQPVFATANPSPHQVTLPSRKDQIASAFENWSLGCQDDLRPALQKCCSKVIWVVGQEDQRFVSVGRDMELIIPKCELIEIPNCGHRVLLENQDAIKEIFRFVERQFG